MTGHRCKAAYVFLAWPSSSSSSITVGGVWIREFQQSSQGRIKARFTVVKAAAAAAGIRDEKYVYK